jgi:hypothetical protein
MSEANILSLSEIKSEHTDAVIRRESVSGECARQPEQPAVPAQITPPVGWGCRMLRHLLGFSLGSRKDQYSMTEQLLLRRPPMGGGETLWTGGICVKFRATSPRRSRVERLLTVLMASSH